MSDTKEKWITVFRNETSESGKQIRMIYVDSPNIGERICRVFGHPSETVQGDRARLIAAAPETKQQRDDLLKACENSPAPNFFADFANFAEECLEKPSMAVYRNQFRALATFLRSCTDRSEKIIQAIAKAKDA